jgi:hypothetical protein
MKEFKFVMNDYENVCYVFVDVNMPPVDTLHLIESKGRVTGNLIKKWVPQLTITKSMLGYYNTNLDKVKELYNTYYDTIVDELNESYIKDLLKLPDSISGYYLDHHCNEIAITDLRTDEDRFGIVNTLEQARGMVAFCELSHILPVFNEGWEPNWNEETIKHGIRTFEDGAIQTYGTFGYPAFLAFETEEKAELFLKEKIDLITDLSKAGFI